MCSQPFTAHDVVVRCNEIARGRWAIETCIDDEKRHGYQYEHLFSYDWNAIRGYHYLMRIAHLMNALTFKTLDLAGRVAEWGVQRFIDRLRTTYAGPWLDRDHIRRLWQGAFQLRLE